MRFSTPLRFADWFYLSVNTAAPAGDEQFGLSVGRLYLGRYCDGWASGILNAQGAL